MRQRTRAASCVVIAAFALVAALPAHGQNSPPASVALTLDTSGSVGTAQFARARDLALAILAALPEGSEVAVLAFNDQSRVMVPWTSQPDEVRARLTAIQVGGRYTALHDALYDASRYVRDAPGVRKAIVLITDGVDENSALSLEDGLRVATDAQIPVFAIGVGAHPQERVLRRIAKLTSGEYVAFDRARGADLAATIAALPERVAAPPPAAAPAAGDAAGRAAATPGARGAPAGAPPPPLTPLVPSRYLWRAVGLTVLAAVMLIVLAWRQRQTAGSCGICGKHLPGGSSSCAFCAEIPTKIPARQPPGRATGPAPAAPRPGADAPPELSETVIARIDTTEEYLERTMTLQERPVLAITRGPGAGQVFELSATSATSIGRSRANDIQVEDVSISGQHCRVRPEDGGFVLHDLRSTNGTLVNDKKVSRHVLEEGDVIAIGETSLQYRHEMKRG